MLLTHFKDYNHIYQYTYSNLTWLVYFKSFRPSNFQWLCVRNENTVFVYILNVSRQDMSHQFHALFSPNIIKKDLNLSSYENSRMVDIYKCQNLLYKTDCHISLLGLSSNKSMTTAYDDCACPWFQKVAHLLQTSRNKSNKVLLLVRLLNLLNFSTYLLSCFLVMSEITVLPTTSLHTLEKQGIVQHFSVSPFRVKSLCKQARTKLLISF